MRLKILTLFFCLWAISGCKQPEPVEMYTVSDAAYIHQCVKKLTDIIVVDIFPPPVASRVYVYPLIAAYEAGRFASNGAPSVSSRLHGFEAMPSPEQGLEYDFTLAAVKAFCTVAEQLVFSKDEIKRFESGLLEQIGNRCSKSTFDRSVGFGQQIADKIILRLRSDNYNETRGMPRFEVLTKPGLWVPTLPDYADALEPHWMKMHPLTLDSATQCRPMPPIHYSEDKTGEYWKQLMEVYNFVNTITPEQDEIAIFWDDNPFVSRVKGHLMFGDKKMTPGGHWLAICGLVGKEKQLDFFSTLKTYTYTSIALFDAFISCWHEKYRANFVRPETVINQLLDKDWRPWLVSPNFPSYTSGHSTVSAAAAEALTHVLGDNIAFTDTTEQEYGLPVRSFTSFRQAALEASISRVYAGIHYRMDCEVGNLQGIEVAKMVLERLETKVDNF